MPSLIIRRGENKAKPRMTVSHRNTPHLGVPDLNRRVKMQRKTSDQDHVTHKSDKEQDI